MVNININFILKSTSIVFSSGKVYCNSIFSKKSIKFFNSTAILSEKFYKMDNRSSLLSFKITSCSYFTDFIYRLTWKNLKVLAKNLNIVLKRNPTSIYIVCRIKEKIDSTPVSELPLFKKFLTEQGIFCEVYLDEQKSKPLSEIIFDENFHWLRAKQIAWCLNITLVEYDEYRKFKKILKIKSLSLRDLDKDRINRVETNLLHTEQCVKDVGTKQYAGWRAQLYNQIAIEWAIQVCQLEVVYK